MTKLKSFKLLVYNTKSGVFFTAQFKGDRYATAMLKASKKLPSPLYYIVGQSFKMEDMKGCVNSWVTDSGLFIPCGYMGHNNFASEFLRGIGKLKFVLDNGYPYQVLHGYGWLRLLNWGTNEQDTKVYFDDLTTMPNQAQKETLIEWCALNNVKYEELFNR